MSVKKLSVFLILIGLMLTLFISPSAIFAQPAPSLSYINIAAITSDGDNYQWHYPEQEYLSTGYTARGNEVVIAIYVEGYTSSSSPRVSVDGVDITNDIEEPHPKEYLTGPGNLVYGYIAYKAVPLEYFENKDVGIVTVSARDINNGNITRSITRNFRIDWNSSQEIVPAQLNNDGNLKEINKYDKEF